MARNTRIRNVGRESINLYPFQILLERNEEVVAEITPSEFLTQFGGTNNSVLNNLSISPTGDAPTVTKAATGGGASSLGALTNVNANADSLSAGANNYVLSWDGQVSEFIVQDASGIIQERPAYIDFDEVPAGGGSFINASPFQLGTNVELYMLETGLSGGAGQQAVTVRLPQISAFNSASRKSIYIRIKFGELVSTYPITIEPHASDTGVTIDGDASRVINIDKSSIDIYTGGRTDRWRVS